MGVVYVMYLLMMSSLVFLGVTSYTLTISPSHVHTSQEDATVSVTCTADVALAACQFCWWDHKTHGGPVLEPSGTTQAQSNASYTSVVVLGSEYHNTSAGRCVVQLQVSGYKEWMFGCRVRTEAGGWTYAWMDLFADTRGSVSTSVSLRETVALIGGEVRLVMSAPGEPLDRCRFLVPELGAIDLNEGAESEQSRGRHRYLGGGLEGGECGLALTDVTLSNNGPVKCWVANTARAVADLRFAALIVARPPSPPTLRFVQWYNNITATCAVSDGNPAANITWLLGDDVIRRDSLDDSPGESEDEWRWPWMGGTIAQTVTLELQPGDNGKVLTCAVSHVTLASPLQITRRISLTGNDDDDWPGGISADQSAFDDTTGTNTINYLTTSSTTESSLTSSPTPGTSTSSDVSSTTDDIPEGSTQHEPAICPTLHQLCREDGIRAAQPRDTKDEVYEFCGLVAKATLRTAELTSQTAELVAEAAKSTLKAEETNALAALLSLEAAKSSSKTEETKALEALLSLEAAKSIAKTEETKALEALLSLETAKSIAKIRIRQEEAKAIRAEIEAEAERVSLEALKFSAKAEEESKVILAELAAKKGAVALDAAKSSVKLMDAQLREAEVWATNAEEVLQADRELRNQSTTAEVLHLK